ncbi:hypothetical protein Gohar_012518, partial [Gossypium harknessii]|nr:hypothetical protein [Gossypium harknessii]
MIRPTNRDEEEQRRLMDREEERTTAMRVKRKEWKMSYSLEI